MCWFSMAKLFMFVFNFALFGAGAAVLGVGIWIFQSGGSIDAAGITISENGSIVLMTAGGLAVLMGFLGCCGAKNESSGVLGLYFFLLLIIVILQIAVGIWAACNFDSVDDIVTDGLNGLNLNTTGGIATMNELSKQFECCGRNDTCGDLDNYATEGLTCTCESVGANCKDVCAKGSVFVQTCPVAITNFLDENMRIIAGIGLAIGALEILGLIFSWCMCQAIKEHKGYA